MGGEEVEKKQKKNQARENVPPKNSFKVKPKGKRIMESTGPLFH